MLVLLFAAICVTPGSVVESEVDLPLAPIYGGTLSSENPYIAAVTGSVPARHRRANITVHGIRQGKAKLWMHYVSGMSSHKVVVGEMIVDDALSVTVSPVAAVVPTGMTVMLTAITSGPDVAVAWYEGDRYVGIGHAISLALPQGAHRVRAEAWNQCGTVTSEALVTVIKPRQRAVRH